VKQQTKDIMDDFECVHGTFVADSLRKMICHMPSSFYRKVDKLPPGRCAFVDLLPDLEAQLLTKATK